MVKIPGLDDLKKMGNDLLDSAKSVNLSDMVDKVKSGIESVGGKKGPDVVTDENLKTLFQGIYSSLNDLTITQTIQITTLKKITTQLEELAHAVETHQKPATPTQDTTTHE